MANITPTGLDPLFGIHAEALKVQRSRMEVLASNIANADTPNYQARDIDFAQVLAQAQKGESPERLLTTNVNHLSGAQGAGSSSDVASTLPLSYRVPMQPAVDGNTVDTQIEQASFADASLHYQASLNFIDGRIKSLLTAITGQ
jgi:flagellar basal-body rod protein FlgB